MGKKGLFLEFLYDSFIVNNFEGETELFLFVESNIVFIFKLSKQFILEYFDLFVSLYALAEDVIFSKKNFFIKIISKLN